VLRRMVRGVNTRDYGDVIDLTRDGVGVQKSSVSRDFVRASAAQVKALAERRFDGMHFPVILIDGAPYVRPIRPGRRGCLQSRAALCRAWFRSPGGRLRT
jgi:hypothetical protein